MMSAEIRAITSEEFAAFSRVVGAAFGTVHSDDEVERWRSLTEFDRAFAAVDGGEIVGTAAVMSLALTVPGGTTLPTGGLTAVSVLTTHRRRGLLRDMMTRQLDDSTERGEPISVLTASESVIYPRFGYGPATSAWRWVLPTEATVLQWPSSAGGRIRMLDGPAAAKLVPHIYERACRRHPGSITRSPRWWELWGDGKEDPGTPADRDPRFQVVHESPTGDPDGFVSWRPRSPGDDSGLPTGQIHVEDLYAVDDEVEAALWEHLWSIDLVRSIHARTRPVEEPLRWRLADPRRLQVRKHADHLWLRILDPGVALGSRRYRVTDRLVLGLSDPLRPANERNWLVEGGPQDATCSPTALDPDLVLGAPELACLFLGGTSASLLHQAGRLQEWTPHALGRADAFFGSSRVPWCGTHF